MSGLTEQLWQPSGHASLDDERCRAADEIERLHSDVDSWQKTAVDRKSVV
jgi:hypothetical protein